jgi:hypothetical protein
MVCHVCRFRTEEEEHCRVFDKQAHDELPVAKGLITFGSIGNGSLNGVITILKRNEERFTRG